MTFADKRKLPILSLLLEHSLVPSFCRLLAPAKVTELRRRDALHDEWSERVYVLQVAVIPGVLLLLLGGLAFLEIFHLLLRVIAFLLGRVLPRAVQDDVGIRVQLAIVL